MSYPASAAWPPRSFRSVSTEALALPEGLLRRPVPARSSLRASRSFLGCLHCQRLQSAWGCWVAFFVLNGTAQGQLCFSVTMRNQSERSAFPSLSTQRQQEKEAKPSTRGASCHTDRGGVLGSPVDMRPKGKDRGHTDFSLGRYCLFYPTDIRSSL